MADNQDTLTGNSGGGVGRAAASLPNMRKYRAEAATLQAGKKREKRTHLGRRMPSNAAKLQNLLISLASDDLCAKQK
jgi:hypothetical protein